MSSIWRRGSATAEQVRGDLAPKHKLKESTIRTLLGRPGEKGAPETLGGRANLRVHQRGGAQSFAIRAVRQLIERFCAGSAEQLLVGWWTTKCWMQANCGVWRRIDKRARLKRSRKGGSSNGLGEFKQHHS